MGKIRVKTLGVEQMEKQQAEEAAKRRAVKKAKKEGVEVTQLEETVVKTDRKGGERKETVVKTDRKGGERMAQVVVSEEDVKKQQLAEKATEKIRAEDRSEDLSEEEKKKLPPQVRRKTITGKKYLKAKKMIEAGKKYTVSEAIKLVKNMSYAGFDETVELHVNVRDNNVKGEVALPHGTGTSVRVAIADEALVKKLESGDIDFDILIAKPAFMPKLVPFAKMLGPKGLMPNPKRGTVTEKPEEAAKKFAAGAIHYKTEPKAPIIHQAVGKISFKDADLAENITALLADIKKKNIVSAHISATMTPGVEIEVERLSATP